VSGGEEQINIGVGEIWQKASIRVPFNLGELGDAAQVVDAEDERSYQQQVGARERELESR
jgi:hypothetical protein